MMNEFPASRILDALRRRIADVPDRLWWLFGSGARHNRTALRELKDRHRGETCVIICNGPSLNRTDLKLIRDLPSIGMNRSYLMFEQWGFVPTYFAVTAQHVIEQFAEDIRQLPMPKFVNASYRSRFAGDRDCFYLRIPPRVVQAFGTDLAQPISSGGTVTYAALQVAYHLGFATVIIIGMDHRFAAQGTPNATEVRQSEVDRDHMHPDYFPKGTKWELPDLRRSEIAYRFARQAYEAAGRRIIDATVDGACTVFEKMALKDALDR
ncbi:6-hydroxymethylpterin diphosphokinase MptE-like protein [Novosphingobium colocasiae]|uniref:6-hydroxymethylpterin diphosphokinase MptE-like domain-containing protein n=1 Tax=Novosphingobium colocasiae TaxID=1256513 RepID=A0A918PCF9_9SPHN|nr:6-hydroxymethylpterin diphosphokinase MptE-like protein [Novosphingobium colocasiae]GGY96578.1 hypothetical protein GCM10011614_09280 [Novosphingobium colocasiae]